MRLIVVQALLGVWLLVAGCGEQSASEPGDPTAVALLEPTDEYDAHGEVRFVEEEHGVRVIARVAGLEPNALHGFHVHEHGDCTAPDASSAGGHFAPHGHPHALPPTHHRHAGDMGNLRADSEGVARLNETFDTLTVSEGVTAVLGHSVVVHADPDDGSETSNSGPRAACGVIVSAASEVEVEPE